MAVLFIDGFDHCSTAELQSTQRWDYVQIGYGVNSSINTGRYGNGLYLGLDGAVSMTGDVRKNLAVGNSGVVGFALKVGASPGFETARGPFRLLESGTTHLQLLFSSANPHVLSVYRAGTLLGTGTIGFSTDAWVYVELKFTIGDSGSYALRINGIQSVAGTSVDTMNGGTGSINQVCWQAASNVFGTMTRVDDIYVQSGGDFLGDLRVEYLVPTGVGARTQFAPSTGSNWQTVDEAPASDSDYNSSSSPGAMDLFQMGNLVGNGLVHAVQTQIRFKKDDAGNRRGKPMLYKATGSGDTARWYPGIQSPAYDGFLASPVQTYAVSPDTGVAWTVDEVNALQYGYAVGDAGMFTLDAKLV